MGVRPELSAPSHALLSIPLAPSCRESDTPRPHCHARSNQPARLGAIADSKTKAEYSITGLQQCEITGSAIADCLKGRILDCGQRLETRIGKYPSVFGWLYYRRLLDALVFASLPSWVSNGCHNGAINGSGYCYFSTSGNGAPPFWAGQIAHISVDQDSSGDEFHFNDSHGTGRKPDRLQSHRWNCGTV